MKCVLVWLAVMATTTTFHVLGTRTTNMTAGRIVVCVNGVWRAVCDEGWEEQHARTICHLLDFPHSRHCRNSCFGCSSQRGVNFRCSDDFTCTLADSQTHEQICAQCAGVVCTKEILGGECTSNTIPPDMSSSASPVTESTDSEPETTLTSITAINIQVDMITDAEDNTTIWIIDGNETQVEGVQQVEPCPSLAALGGGLGGLCAILAILLVGVVMGWVWFYFKQKEKPSGLHKRSNGDHDFPNPTYTPTSPNFVPSVQYSSLGPRGTPHPHAPSSSAVIYDAIDSTSTPQGGREGVYHVLDGSQEREEGREGAYHLLEEAGEGKGPTTVPSSAQPAAQQAAGVMEYSRLQHKATRPPNPATPAPVRPATP